MDDDDMFELEDDCTSDVEPGSEAEEDEISDTDIVQMQTHSDDPENKIFQDDGNRHYKVRCCRFNFDQQIATCKLACSYYLDSLYSLKCGSNLKKMTLVFVKFLTIYSITSNQNLIENISYMYKVHVQLYSRRKYSCHAPRNLCEICVARSNEYYCVHESNISNIILKLSKNFS